MLFRAVQRTYFLNIQKIFWQKLIFFWQECFEICFRYYFEGSSLNHYVNSCKTSQASSINKLTVKLCWQLSFPSPVFSVGLSVHLCFLFLYFYLSLSHTFSNFQSFISLSLFSLSVYLSFWSVSSISLSLYLCLLPCKDKLNVYGYSRVIVHSLPILHFWTFFTYFNDSLSPCLALKPQKYKNVG